MNKLALGTAQFGEKYGIANKIGAIHLCESKKILKIAKNNNLKFLDTAISYRGSEKILGKTDISNFKIISKLPDPPYDCSNIKSWVKEQIQKSLESLRIKSFYGILLHNSKSILGLNGKKIINSLNEIKLEGFAKKIGISIYDPSELEQVMNLINIDIIQAPLNIMDRRLETSGWLDKLFKNNIEIYTRSTFLQGLLLMPRKQIPNKFKKWSFIWDKWHSKIIENNLSATSICLAYPLSLSKIYCVIVGVDSSSHLETLLKESKKNISLKNWSFMESEDKDLINPINWSSL